MRTLYEVLGIESNHSIFKSVFLTGEKTEEGYEIVRVEPYDSTFLSATENVNKYDKTIEIIMLKVYKYFQGENIWLIIDTDNFGHSEHLLSEYSMKNIYKLI